MISKCLYRNSSSFFSVLKEKQLIIRLIIQKYPNLDILKTWYTCLDPNYSSVSESKRKYEHNLIRGSFNIRQRELVGA